MCNVFEMYLRIELAPQNRKYRCFLWEIMDEATKPDVFESNSLVLGVKYALFEAQLISQKHELDLKDAHLVTVDAILNLIYTDDSMESVGDENCGIKLYQELSTFWGKTNMHARKWLSNSAKVSEKIPVEICANKVDLSKEYLSSVKTLGCFRIGKEDQLTYHSVPIEAQFQYAKRNLLRKI